MSEITYEITAVVEGHLIADFERFMVEQHIPDLLKTKAFSAATFSRSSAGRYRTRYEAWNRAKLDGYLKRDAPRLRAHMKAAFPEGVEFSREEWEVLARFDER